jgi:hypothetical protein
MKAIAISTIAVFLIAIVSIMILISFVGGQLPPALKKGYCNTIRGLVGLLPLPESMKPSLPPYCTTEGGQNVVTIESGDVNKISYEIAARALACWEQTGKIGLGQDRNCYEIVLKRVDGEVTRENVTSYMKNYENIIDWQIGNITEPKSVGIFYNSTGKTIGVV